MSSMYSRPSKEYTRSRISQSDTSPPSSPSPTAKTSSRHERLARMESGGSSLASADSNSDRATSAYLRREKRLQSLNSKPDEDSQKDFKKLYESAYNENEKLKSNLREAQLELANIKSKLERVAKKQDQSSSNAGLLEAEKREKRVLERKMSEMEDDLKVLTDLKSDNQRLKDENGALIRVISKLSK
ncbi:protein phosphatase 1 regulatory subunit 12B-like isoform X2 [Hyperolius riggenbachi]|uniref:protein phosphatase 1 regulatory subunit 12B-like isoform X2 n=1 Tax=Hyperolius riggenbachi TaxID=752182 RepID=UPI0035A38FEE